MFNAKERGLWATSGVLVVLALASFTYLQDSDVSNASTLNLLTRAPSDIPVALTTPSVAGPTSASSQQTRIGPIGLQGKTGAQGSAGTTGLQGPVGISGLQGIAGVAGAQGVAGANGLQGPVGANGANGATGAQGIAGTSGPQGPAGDPGPQGPAGEGIPKGYIEQRFCYDAKTLAVTFGECANREIGVNLIWLISDSVKG